MAVWVEYLHDLCCAGSQHQHVFMVARDEDTSSMEMRKLICEMFDWCVEYVGPNDRTAWNCDTLYVMFTFKNEEDAFAFRMRWC